MEYRIRDICKLLLLILPGVVLSDSLNGNPYYRYNFGASSQDVKFGCPDAITSCNGQSKYRTFDGTCNNLNNPTWGSAGIKYRRFLPPQYDRDLTYCKTGNFRVKLPTAREVVSALNRLAIRQKSTLTVLAMQWGQFLSHDVNQTPDFEGIQCCVDCSSNPFENSNCLAIDVRDDFFYRNFGVECMENRRSVPAGSACSDEREQVNVVTAFIDGSLVYGANEETARIIRTGSGGLMKVRPAAEILFGGPCPSTATCPFTFLPTTSAGGQETLLLGDARAVQNPSLTSVHTLFLRVHNDIAKRLAAKYSSYNDEKTYQEARKIVIALIQHITYNEFLPSILPSSALSTYKLTSRPSGSGYIQDYDPSVDGSLRNAFSAAAYRFGHSLIPDIIELPTNNMELARSFFNHTFTFNLGYYPSDFLNGESIQRSEQLDQRLVSTISNRLFADGPNFIHGTDLYSKNILRGRDHGLPPYNKFREFCNLPLIRSLEDLKGVMIYGVARVFEKLYPSYDDIELYPALLSERPDSDGVVGPTLTCLLSRQFQNLKIGDRFFYENKKNNPGRFTLDQLNSIRRTSLSVLLCRYTNTKSVPESAFKILGDNNFMQDCRGMMYSNVISQLENLF